MRCAGRKQQEVCGRRSGWQHWDKLNRSFAVWVSRADDRGDNGGERLRRIDIVVTVWIERAFALHAWTGSRMLNRMTRLLANEHGLSLSAHCLLTVPPREAIGEEAHRACRLVPYETHPCDAAALWEPVRNEEDLFRLIGIPWVSPRLRNA